MYEAFYGLSEKPFSIAPKPSFFYLSRKHHRALALLEYGLANEVGFSVITGAIGCGKTTLVRKLLQDVTDEVVFGVVNNTQCESFDEMLRWVLLAFDLEYRGKDKVELYQTLADFLHAEREQQKRAVLIIDEAQNLDETSLEQLRMLSNINTEYQLLQMILVGQPNLWDLLRAPSLEQFTQRIAVEYHLDALDRDETVGYVRHRLEVAGGSTNIFADNAFDPIWEHTNGVPRLINLLCDMALVYGYADQMKVVDAKVIEEVVRDKRSGLMPRREEDGLKPGARPDVGFGW